MKDKIVCFAGHRHEFQNIGIEQKLKETIITLIEKGYNVFYDGNKGSFDKICLSIIINLKQKYPNIKIYRILSNYNHKKEKCILPSFLNGFILPDIEHYHPKLKIKKRNEWIVDNSDILVCHIYETYKSGAYSTLKYAQKKNKPIIYI